MDDRRQARTTVCLALGLYCAALIVLDLSTSSPRWGEIVSIVLSVVSIIGLIAYALPSVVVPGERYAYLVTGWAGFTTLLMYLVLTDDPTPRRVAIALVLGSGAVSAYGAYLGRER